MFSLLQKKLAGGRDIMSNSFNYFALNWTAENDLLLKNAHILALPHFFQLGTIFHSGHI